MAKKQRVSDDELMTGSYIDDMLGEGDGDISVDLNDGEGGEESDAVVVPQKGNKGQQTDDDQSAVGGNGKQNQQGQPGKGKQPGQKQVGQQQQQQNNRPGKGQVEKINLTDPQQLQVYKAVQQRMQPVIDALDIKLKRADQELNTYRARDQIFQEYKLNPKEHLNAVQLAVALKNKPKETIEFLIGQAQATGVQFKFSNGQDMGTSADAIRQMIESAIAPVARQAREQEQRVGATQQAQEMLTTFYGKYPDARVHETAIDSILQRNPQLDLMDAYVRLRSFYADKGLDWNIPLEQHAQPQDGGQQQQQHQQQRPFNARGVSNSIEQQDNENEPVRLAPANASFRSIIKQAMAEEGLDTARLTHR